MQVQNKLDWDPNNRSRCSCYSFYISTFGIFLSLFLFFIFHIGRDAISIDAKQGVFNCLFWRIIKWCPINTARYVAYKSGRYLLVQAKSVGKDLTNGKLRLPKSLQPQDFTEEVSHRKKFFLLKSPLTYVFTKDFDLHQRKVFTTIGQKVFVDKILVKSLQRRRLPQKF